MRVKHRYLIAQLLPSSQSQNALSLTSRDIQNNLKAKIEDLFGSMAGGEFGNNTTVRYFDSEHAFVFVIRTPRETYSKVHFAISSICKIKDVDAVVRVLRIHGSSRTCRTRLRSVLDAAIRQSRQTQSEKDAALAAVDKTLSAIEL
jgi:RNase P/RNase MRP subunit POP5